MLNFLVYLKFRNKAWNKLSFNKRVKYAQKIEQIEAGRFDRKTFDVVPKTLDENVLGLCDYENKTIYLSKELFEKEYLQFYLLWTLFHEGRHATQHSLVSETKYFLPFSRARKFKRGFEGYISHKDGKFSYYSMQEVERDAGKYAINRMWKLKFWLGRERGYAEIYDQMVNEFEKNKFDAKKELGPFYKIKIGLKQRKNIRDRE